MNIFLFDSHSLEASAVDLSSQMKKDGTGLFSKALVVISHSSVKEWLQIELCKQAESHSVLGLQFVGWRKAVQILSGQSFFPSRAQIAIAIWQYLKNHPTPCDQFMGSEKSAIDFVGHLASLFAEYNEYGLPEKIPEPMAWQKECFEAIFQSNLDTAAPTNCPLYLFGLDVLPPAVMRFFFKASQVRLFRFSPCAMFWEDLCSSAERKKMLKKWASSSHLQALDALLKDTQPLLANWGKLGRKMLALAPEVNGENYELEDRDTLLNGLKLDLLLSSQDHREVPADESLRCIRTGSSRLHEVKVLQAEIRNLAQQGISFADIRVYAPDMESYAPLIEFCFDDVPFRIAGVDIARKDPFYQALLKLFSCVKGRWEADTLLSLFEMPVFYRKAGWKSEEVERIGQWIHQSGIRWGLNGKHRQEEAQVTDSAEPGSWQAGIDSLLDSWVFFRPEEENSMGWSEAELFERFYEMFDSLRKRLISWRSPRTLQQWADEIAHCVETYLWSDGESLAERGVTQAIEQLRSCPNENEPLPFSLIETFFFSDVSGELGGSSLHSVRFASLELGAILPARAIFVLGMDEESFPRISAHSSLRLASPASITQSESDCYLFLSLIFAAKERLIFSYGHQSPDDGKQVSPSLLIQELFGYLKNAVEETASPLKLGAPSKATSILTAPDRGMNEISIQELSRWLKNPFQSYLKSVLGITLKEEPESIWEDFEFSSLSRHLMLRAFLEQTPARGAKIPLGLFGLTAEQKIAEETKDFAESLAGWGIAQSSIHTVLFDQPILDIRISGEATLAVSEGALHLGSDNIGSAMRRWVEILSILVAKGKNTVFFLKTGKTREVADPLKALESVAQLYLRAKNGPLFLHPDWADSLLRKHQVPEESEDLILRWALARSPSYDLAIEKERWDPILQPAFASLSSLYPTRSAKHAEV